MSNTHKLWRAVLVTRAALAEAMSTALEENARAVSIFAPPRKSTARIEALFDAPPDRAELEARVAIAAATQSAKPPKIEISAVPELNWLKKVAGDFPPFPIARWTIYGAQHRDKVLRPGLALQIDATSAFGTGEHPTTHGCLVMLDWMLKQRRPRCALDLGCGSGILAMACAQAVHGKVIAVDVDPESVRIARENVRVNGLQENVRVGLGRGYNSNLVRAYAPYDLIMANIFAGPLCAMAKDLKRHLRPGGVAILSGILNYQANKVIAAHRMQGLRLIRRIKIGEWSVLALQRGDE